VRDPLAKTLFRVMGLQSDHESGYFEEEEELSEDERNVHHQQQRRVSDDQPKG